MHMQYKKGQILIGVYGSLRKGGSNHHKLERASFKKSLQEKVALKMVDLGSYPALVKSDKLTNITFQIFKVSEVDLADLDQFEGQQYRREMLLIGGLNVFVYIGSSDYKGTVIESGDWLSYQKQKQSMDIMMKKPCCGKAKRVREKCIALNGEEKCQQFIEAHKFCLAERKRIDRERSEKVT